MYRILDSLNGKVYQELVSLLIKRSDSFLFHLPNMGKTVVNHRNAPFMTGYPIGYSKEKDQDLHLAYMKWVKRYIDLIRDDIIESHTDTGYLDQISSIEMEVYHVAISERTSGFFGQTDDFSKWMYPAFPEDPCFLSDGKCVFQCIAHEKLFFVMEDREIKRFLKRNRISFFKE